MAEREYIITLINDTDTGGGKPVAGEQSDGSGKAAKNIGAGGGTQTAITAGLVAWRTVKPWVNQTISHQMNVVNLRDGSTELAQRRQFGYQVATQAVGIVESTLAGFAVGNVAGAIVGAVVGVGHTLLSYANNQQMINERRTLENRSLQMNYIRAGARGSRASYE